MTSEEEQARRDKRWKKLQAQPKGGATGALGELMTVFSPGVQHTADEQRRMANTAYQQDTEGDPPGVDLDKGIVKLGRKKA
ncbi:MAG: DUF6191 domain-containing protein [Mycobacteriales bacterium]